MNSTLNGTLRPLREQVARALYEAAPSTPTDWDDLPPPRQAGWYDDADIALSIVLRATHAAAQPSQDDPRSWRGNPYAHGIED